MLPFTAAEDFPLANEIRFSVCPNVVPANAARIGVKVETNGRFGHSVLLREEHGGHFEIGLEEAGDYTIFIGSLNGKPVTFNMTVSIRKLSDI